jgi:hypothetical protein
LEDQSHKPSSQPEGKSLRTNASGKRWIGRRFSRRVLAVGLALPLVIPGGAALASVWGGAGQAGPAKMVAGTFSSLLHTSHGVSAAKAVYAPNTPTSAVKAQTKTRKKKPLRCKKGKVKKTKKLHGKKVTVCVPKKKHVKAKHVRRPPSFTG